MTSLPRKERGAEHWRPAVTLLKIIGEDHGRMFFAELAVRFGLRKGVNDPPPEPDSSKKNVALGKTQTQEGRMTDQELVLDSLNKANMLVAEYIQPGARRDAAKTLNALIFILQDKALGAAVDRLEAGFGLKVVK